MNINKNWKELKTPYMIRLLKRGIRKVKRNKIKISDGSLISLFYFDTKRKWHYQVDYVKDYRFKKTPYVAVFAFNPKIEGCERADYYLYGEVKV